jgi:hypothetical protein
MAEAAGGAHDAVNAIRNTRCRVDEVRPLLEDASPAALDRCTSVLAAAVSAAGGLSRHADHGPGTRRLAEEAALLHSSVRRAARLLQSAAEYHARWNGLLGAMSAGYTASGAPAPPGRAGRLNLRG